MQDKEREKNQNSKATVEVKVKEVAIDAETGPPPRGQLWVEVNALDDNDLTSRLRGAGEPDSFFGENESMKKTRLVAPNPND